MSSVNIQPPPFPQAPVVFYDAAPNRIPVRPLWYPDYIQAAYPLASFTSRNGYVAGLRGQTVLDSGWNVKL
jgi:hypothetical protein